MAATSLQNRMEVETFELECPSLYVISQQSCGAVFAIINIHFVMKEIRKRVHDTPNFKSCIWKWLSLLCIMGGFLHSFVWMMHYFDGLCLFLGSVAHYINMALPMCVGLYQITRLYQYFADENKGKIYLDFK